ncbi:hypothetical protein ACFLXQ_06895, partial [Chloroflexota bacterium]
EAEELLKAEQRAGAKSLEEAVQAVQTARPDLSGEVIEKAKQEVRIKSFDDSAEVKQAIREAVTYLNFNPRKIKRFINLLRLQALIANRRGLLANKQIQLKTLAKWLLIANLWPNAIEGIVNEPEEFINRLQQAREAKENLNQARMTGNEKLQKDNEPTLNVFLADPFIAQLIDENELIELLSSIDTSSSKALTQYLHLAQIGIDTPGRVFEGSAMLKAEAKLEAAANATS